MTGNSLSDLLTSALIDPLGLNASSYAQPAYADRAVVPFDAITSSYSDDLFEEAAGGGYYSSLNDLTKIALSILNSTFLTPAQTRKWLKPTSFSSNVNNSVGTPWEIYRAPGERVSYLYTKAGQLGLYSSQLALMPDYDVGFTVLAAGPAGGQQVRLLSDLISEIFYPALEATAKDEADSNYAGTFQDPTGINSSITIVTDDRPGLGVQQWIFNGTDAPSLFAALVLPQLGDSVEIGVRLYPTGLKTTEGGQVTRTAFRAVFDLPAPRGIGPFSSNCDAWLVVDGFSYGGIGLDEFVFHLGSDGKAVSVEPRVLQQSPLQIARQV